MSGRDLSVAAALHILLLVCTLGAASGVEIQHITTRAFIRAMAHLTRFGYPPGKVVVIDLGNTNSCVAGYGPAADVFQFCIPSWVAFTGDGSTASLVGEAAKNHADANPENTIFGYKRLLGLRRNHKREEEIVQRLIERVPYKIGARNVVRPAVQVKSNDDGEVVEQVVDITKVASVVVAALKEAAEARLGSEVRHAVVTVPQHFGEPATRAAVDACKHAGLEVEDTVSELVAAAVAYGLHRTLRDDGNALVLRVGGGTADASVATLWDGSLEVLGYRDDPFLRGDDFDQRIVDYFVKLVKTKHGKDISEDTVALRKLRTACERAKKALSSQDRVQVNVESLFDGVDFSEPLLRSQFEELNDDLFRKVVALVEKAMVQAKPGKNKIHEIVLVGGSTMIPKIQKLVRDYFGGKEPNIRIKPDEAIALGAAVLVHA
ncbi:hypothetical protein EJB05_02296, partial [Eragrostis curvula]